MQVTKFIHKQVPSRWSTLEHSDSEKKYSDLIRFDFPKRIDFLIRFDSAHHCRIGYYRLLCCQMSTLLRHHESPSQLHKDVGWDYGSMIIVQANAAAESNG